MLKQIIFIASLIITLGVFTYTVRKYVGYFKLTKKNFPIRNIGKRIAIMLEVAIGQTKIFRKPFLGLLHALVFWGFCVILIGSVEMVIDGVAGTERALGGLGIVYDVIFGSGDIFAFIIAVAIIIFLIRRIFLNVKRFNGIEMKHENHVDANIALSLILILMITLLGMNTFYVENTLRTGHEVVGAYPISQILAGSFSGMSDVSIHFWHEFNWWAHILVIFFFANYLPYSKHFHVYLSVPNTFLSRLEPLGYLPNMPNITKEVEMMLDPNAALDESTEESTEKFGVADITDISWKNYFDSLACTQCGRCTSVCPANITGKKLSPRKIIMDVRSRMKEVGDELVKNKEYTDGKALLRDWISEEELWACTTCNACAQECPININHPTLIVDLRRYLVMEEAASPGELNAMFSNIENNGAPWQFNQQDRMRWTEDITMNIK